MYPDHLHPPNPPSKSLSLTLLRLPLHTSPPKSNISLDILHRVKLDLLACAKV